VEEPAVTALNEHEARLVTPQELLAHLGDPGWVVVDARFRIADRSWGPRAYAEGHIPGAFYAHLEEDLSEPPSAAGGRHPLPDPGRLARFLAARGVGPKTTLVVYDEASLPGAFRLWWLALWIGLRHVCVLDGGFRAWAACGLPLTAAVPTPLGARSATLVPALREGLSVTTEEVERSARGDADAALVLDARERRRYLGLEEPIDPVAGHIPRARNLPYLATLDTDGRLLAPAELRSLFTRVLGAAPPRRIAHACGSGVTACQTLFAMTRAGFGGGLLYPGSYSAWVAEPRHTVARGAEDGLGDEDFRPV
jgi:thiosulfate/3-mercaptopyruvate sulfurtransferase